MIYSCKTASPRLTNSHAGIYKVEKIPDGDFLTIQAAIVPIIPPKTESKKAKTFFDLRDSIPQTFLKVLGGNVSTGADFIKYIKEPLSNEPEKTPAKLKTDFATQKVQFVLGNVKNYQVLASKENPEFLHPNTRLASLNTKLDFSNTDFQIVSIDKLESEFETIDLGSISRTQDANFSSKLTGQYGLTNTSSSKNSDNTSNSSGSIENTVIDNVYDANGNLLEGVTVNLSNNDSTGTGNESNKSSNVGLGVNGEVGYNNKETIAEALQVKLKRLKTGFVFNKENITISQHGSNLLDISDNVIVTASIFPKTGVRTDKVMNFTNLFKDYQPQNASEIKLNRRSIKYMNCQSRSVDVCLSAKGVLRTVENKMRGDNTLEFDDKVIYYPFNLATTSSNTTINNWGNCTTIYKLEYKDPSGVFYDLNAGVGSTYEVHFVETERELFRSWLFLQLRNPTLNKLKHPSLEIYLKERVASPDMPQKRIQIVGPNIDNNDIQKIKSLDIQFKSLQKDDCDCDK